MDKAMFLRLLLGALLGGGLGAVLGYFGKCATGTCPLTANPWRGGLYGMVVGAVFALAAGASKNGVEVPPDETVTTTDVESVDQLVQHIDSPADFDERVLNTALPVLVDFYSDTCPPCRMLGPTIDKLAATYGGRAIIYKVNVDQLPQLAARYDIRGIPAVLFFLRGDERHRLVGLQSESAYISVIDRITN